MHQHMAGPDRGVPRLWDVVTGYDEDRGGAEFAYTVGLAEVGYPELHIRARPIDGLDPGDDWKLSTGEQRQLLNGFAELLLRDELGVGDVLHRLVDGGQAEALFAVEAPVDASAVHALRAGDCEIMPLPWTLQRAPSRPATPLSMEVAHEQRERLAVLLDRLAHPPTDDLGRPRLQVRSLPGVRRPTVNASLSIYQPLGALMPLVRASAIAVASATPGTLATFALRHSDAEQTVGRGHALALARDQAWSMGRFGAVAEAFELAERVVVAVRGVRGRSRRWREVLGLVDLDAVDTPDLRSGLSGSLLDATAGLLATEVVGDGADADLRRIGYGPWEAALSPTGLTPGADWLAPPPALDRARRLLDGMGLLGAGQLAMAHAVRDEAGLLLVSRLRGLASSFPVGSPSAAELLEGSPMGPVVQARPMLNQRLTEWLCGVTALLAKRAAFTDADIAAFCRPTRWLLPELEQTLNDPLVISTG